MIPTHDERHLYRIVRLFEAIRLAAQYLDNYYRTLSIVYNNNNTTQRLYPYITENNTTIHFTYEDYLTGDSKKTIFKGKTTDGYPIVIKFSQRYNAYAHNLCDLPQGFFMLAKKSLGDGI